MVFVHGLIFKPSITGLFSLMSLHRFQQEIIQF